MLTAEEHLKKREKKKNFNVCKKKTRWILSVIYLEILWKVYRLLKTPWIEVFQSQSDKKVCTSVGRQTGPGAARGGWNVLICCVNCSKKCNWSPGDRLLILDLKFTPVLDVLITSPFGQRAAALGHCGRWNRGYGCRLRCDPRLPDT